MNLWTSENDKTKEVIEFLRDKFQIPKNVIKFSVNFSGDDCVNVHCEYYPEMSMEDGS